MSSIWSSPGFCLSPPAQTSIRLSSASPEPRWGFYLQCVHFQRKTLYPDPLPPIPVHDEPPGACIPPSARSILPYQPLCLICWYTPGTPGSPPRSIFNGRGYHPPSLVTTICPSQKRSSSLCRLLPSPYSCKISMNFFYPRSCRPSSHPGTPRTIHYGICMPYFCASLDSNVAIPVPLPFPNPFMASWINMDDLWCFLWWC